jgi:hypothetical protein
MCLPALRQRELALASELMAEDAGDHTELPAVELGRGRHRLRLEVVERNGVDFIVEGHVSIRRFTAVAACDASLADVIAWRAQVTSLYETLAGRAALQQPGFVVSMTALGGGQVVLEGMFDSESICGKGERAVLHFTLPPLDQTDLPGVIAMLDAAVEMPPREEEV